MSTFGPNGEIDPKRGILATFVGKKRSGKSVMALLFFMRYPGDKIVIDVAGDDGPVGPDVVTLTGTVAEGNMPGRLPTLMRDGKKPMIFRYVPDAGSKTFIDDMDHIVGLALDHGQCCILIHEMGVLAEAGKTRVHTRRLLMHNRHNGATTGLFCAPRTVTVDPLVLQQSDLVYTFELQGVADRKRIAESIGWNVKDFDESVHDLGPHEYLLFDANVGKPEDGEVDYRLLHAPALPLPEVERVKKWASGTRPRS